MPYRDTIAAAYDAGVEEEFNRLTESPLREVEYQLIVDLLDEYIPDCATVIDIGSGPGRYAEYLLNRNCKVGVVDLSAKSLKAFSDRMNNSCFTDNILFNQVSCATQLEWIADRSADAILLMGPLYHIINEEHRNTALAHCKRILKPGGFLFSVFLSKFSTSDCALSENETQQAELNATTYTPFKGYQVAQFRCWPCEAKEILKTNHFETIRIRNLEGIGSFITNEKLNECSTAAKKAELLNQLRSTSEEEIKLGITHQFITVSMIDD
jgi:ubiquinone/menaquinone biosynthesis C-methylase UbiE